MLRLCLPLSVEARKIICIVLIAEWWGIIIDLLTLLQVKFLTSEGTDENWQ